MITKIWQYKKEIDLFLYKGECTQKYVENNYNLIAQTEDELPNWFNNFSINRQLYDVHSKTSYKDTDHKILNVFASPYWLKPLKEIKQNPQIENRNNAICPACGYVDYHCWENKCPDENYRCPQCKSHLLLEHRVEYGYSESDALFYQRTTFKKLHHPPKIKVIEIRRENELLQ